MESAPKPKKFFKSRNADVSDAKQSAINDDNIHSDPDYEHPPTKKVKSSNESLEKPIRTSVRKFFSSKNNLEKTVLSSNVNNSKANDNKPPIVLRIFRGKSQLLSDTEESDNTPTLSSTSNTTSPRALRDLSQPQVSSKRKNCFFFNFHIETIFQVQRSANCRITRSARRSMQQDSPTTVDSVGEFSIFMSPKDDIELSPKYIPAEKYEAERKALYDNLLNSNAPTENESQIEEIETLTEEKSQSKDENNFNFASIDNDTSGKSQI